MTQPLLTIGCATYEDFNGVYFTIQSLRLHHAEVMPYVELIVVDNAPNSKGGEDMIAPLMNHAQNNSAGAKYIKMPGEVGTSQPRNAVFTHATGKYVMCMDSHVLLHPGSLGKLIDFYLANQETNDLYSGPMLYDNLIDAETHFDDMWRSEMWGIWGRAWICPCHRDKMMREPLRFSVQPSTEGPHCEFRALKPGKVLVDHCERCGKKIPNILFNGSSQALENLGYSRLDRDANAKPFEIPAMGLGLFTCRKEAWLRFNPHFRGFGGEEMYIHEKYRKAGHKNICLPWLRWLHRFGRPDGVKYPLTRYNKVRNYVLGHKELGMDLTPVKEHFVDTGLVPVAEWEFLLENPEQHTQEVTHAKFVGNTQFKAPSSPIHAVPNPTGQPVPPPDIVTPEALVQWATPINRDLNQHLPKLMELASQVSHVTEFTERRESTIGLLGGKPEKLVSYNTEAEDLVLSGAARMYPWIYLQHKQTSEIPAIEETDLLFLDSSPTYAGLMDEFHKYAKSVKRWIVMHDTVSYGQNGPDGGPGKIPAIREFIKNNPEWFVYWHTNNQYGLSVLGRLPQDKPEQKIRFWPKGFGPGTELKALIASLGINPGPSCDCNAMARQMDEWGVEGCREHFDEIVDRIKQNQARWGWQESIEENAKQEAGEEAPKGGWKLGDTIRAGWKAVTSGLAFKINPLDPIPSLVKMAIHKAEVKNEQEDD